MFGDDRLDEAQVRSVILEVHALDPVQRLAEQKEALQSASRANDVPAIRAAASDMAQTADELKLPSLADIAKCIAMEEETPDAGLIESAIETAQQALN